jgi:hypothetical protein
MDWLQLLLILFMLVEAVGLLAIGALVAAVIVGGLADLWHHRRDFLEQRRRARGLCAGCGYDLRGSGSRCPECGRPIRAYPTPRFLRT